MATMFKKAGAARRDKNKRGVGLTEEQKQEIRCGRRGRFREPERRLPRCAPRQI